MGSLSKATGSDAKYGEPSKASSSISKATGGSGGTPVASGGVSAATGSDAAYGTPTQSPTMTVNGQVVANPNYVTSNPSYDVATRTQSNVLPAPKPLYRDEYGENVYSNREMDVYSRTQVATTPRGTFIGRAARYVEGGQTLSLPPNTSTPQGDVYTPAPYEVPGQSSMYQNVPAQFRSPGIFGGERIDVGAYERATARAEAEKTFIGKVSYGASDIYQKSERFVSEKLFPFSALPGRERLASTEAVKSSSVGLVSNSLSPARFVYTKSFSQESRTIIEKNIPKGDLITPYKSTVGFTYDIARGSYLSVKERPIATIPASFVGGAAFGVGMKGLSLVAGTKAASAVGIGLGALYVGKTTYDVAKAPIEARGEMIGQQIPSLYFFGKGVEAGYSAIKTGYKFGRARVVGATKTTELLSVGEQTSRQSITKFKGRGTEYLNIGIAGKKVYEKLTPITYRGTQENIYFTNDKGFGKVYMKEAVDVFKGGKRIGASTSSGSGLIESKGTATTTRAFSTTTTIMGKSKPVTREYYDIITSFKEDQVKLKLNSFRNIPVKTGTEEFYHYEPRKTKGTYLSYDKPFTKTIDLKKGTSDIFRTERVTLTTEYSGEGARVEGFKYEVVGTKTVTTLSKVGKEDVYVAKDLIKPAAWWETRVAKIGEKSLAKPRYVQMEKTTRDIIGVKSIQTPKLKLNLYGKGETFNIIQTETARMDYMRLNTVSGTRSATIRAIEKGYVGRFASAEKASAFQSGVKNKKGELFGGKRKLPLTENEEVYKQQIFGETERISRFDIGTKSKTFSSQFNIKGGRARIYPFTAPTSRIAPKIELISVPKSSAITRPTTIFRQPVVSVQSPALVQVAGIRNGTSVIQNIKQSQILSQEQRQSQASNIVQIGSTTQTNFNFTPAPLSPPRPGAIPFFQLEPTKRRKKKGKGIKVSFTERYVPSVEALALNIRAPKINMGAIRTGLVVRPIKV